MKCSFCNVDGIEPDDMFCYNCGHLTAKGYNYFHNTENIENLKEGKVMKQDNRFGTLTGLVLVLFISFSVMLIIRGNDLFAPFAYIKKVIQDKDFGYETTYINNYNQYNKKVNSLDEAIDSIVYDYDKQKFMCSNNDDLYYLEDDIMTNYEIPVVSFCEMKKENIEKINEVLEKMYSLYPTTKGYLTNISIVNVQDKTKKDNFIVSFEPAYEFVNKNKEINKSNKVNKTQIVYNSYYYLNDDMLSKNLSEINNNYVKDATFMSVTANAFGHYLLLVIDMKDNNLNNVTYVTKENYELINKVVNNYKNNVISNEIINEALNNYNKTVISKIDYNTFVSLISPLAKNSSNDAVAEAIHDYYLHGTNMQRSSLEIVKVINERIGS